MMSAIRESFGRNAGAKFFIPTEVEWYKAAYHDKTAGLASSYFDYPTGASAVPGNDITETTNAGSRGRCANARHADQQRDSLAERRIGAMVEVTCTCPRHSTATHSKVTREAMPRSL